MKALLLSAVVLASAATAAGAAEGPWCAIYSSAEGGKNCYFATHEQCMADISGKSGWCMPNPDYGRPQYQHR